MSNEQPRNIDLFEELLRESARVAADFDADEAQIQVDQLSRCHHDVAAAMRATIKRSNPKPSRWCSGSKSRAPRVTKRTEAPRALAKERQSAPSARLIAPMTPLPLRAEFFFATTKNRIRNDFSQPRGAPHNLRLLDLNHNRNDHRATTMFFAHPTSNCFAHYL